MVNSISFPYRINDTIFYGVKLHRMINSIFFKTCVPLIFFYVRRLINAFISVISEYRLFSFCCSIIAFVFSIILFTACFYCFLGICPINSMTIFYFCTFSFFISVFPKIRIFFDFIFNCFLRFVTIVPVWVFAFFNLTGFFLLFKIFEIIRVIFM